MLFPFDLFGGFDGGRGITGNGLPMDVVRTGDQLQVSFDLPGIDPDSVELTCQDHVLTVKVERRLQPAEGAKVIVQERLQGSFTRTLYLSDDVDLGQATASYNHGVLTVSAPVTESAQRRRIEVKAVQPKAITSGHPATEPTAGEPAKETVAA